MFCACSKAYVAFHGARHGIFYQCVLQGAVNPFSVQLFGSIWSQFFILHGITSPFSSQ